MPQSIFIFDFGANEEAAQQARHKIDAWKQGFRLGNKMLLKFERSNSGGTTEEESAKEPRKAARGKAASNKSAAAKTDAEKPNDSSNIRLLVRLAFQRWLDRIPAEEPFKSAGGQTIRTGDPEFPETTDLFDSLD